MQRMPVSAGSITIKKPSVRNKNANRSEVRFTTLKSNNLLKSGDSTMTVVALSSLPASIVSAINLPQPVLLEAPASSSPALSASLSLSSSGPISTSNNNQNSFANVSPVTLIPLTTNATKPQSPSTISQSNLIPIVNRSVMEITPTINAQANTLTFSTLDKSKPNQTEIIQLFPTTQGKPFVSTSDQLSISNVSIVPQPVKMSNTKARSKKTPVNASDATTPTTKAAVAKARPKAVRKPSTKKAVTTAARSRAAKNVATEMEASKIVDKRIKPEMQIIKRESNVESVEKDEPLSNLNFPLITMSNANLEQRKDFDIEQLRESLTSKKCIISKWIQVKENDLREKLLDSKKRILMEERNEREMSYIDYLLAQQEMNKVIITTAETSVTSTAVSPVAPVDSVAASTTSKERKISTTLKRKATKGTTTEVNSTTNNVPKPKRIRKKKEPTKPATSLALSAPVSSTINVQSPSTDGKTVAIKSKIASAMVKTDGIVTNELTSISSNPFMNGGLDVNLCSSHYSSGRTTDQLFGSAITSCSTLSGLTAATDLIPNPTISDTSSLLSLSDVTISNLPPVDDALVASIVANLPSLTNETSADGAVSFAESDFNEVLNKLPDDAFGDLFGDSLKASLMSGERSDLTSLERPFASIAKQQQLMEGASPMTVSTVVTTITTDSSSMNSTGRTLSGRSFAPLNLNTFCQTESNQSLNMNDSDILGLASNILGSLTTEQQQQFNGLIDGALAGAALTTNNQIVSGNKSSNECYTTQQPTHIDAPTALATTTTTCTPMMACSAPLFPNTMSNTQVTFTPTSVMDIKMPIYNSTLDTPTTPSQCPSSLVSTPMAPPPPYSQCIMSNGCSGYPPMSDTQFTCSSQSQPLTCSARLLSPTNTTATSLNGSLASFYQDTGIVLNGFHASNDCMTNNTMINGSSCPVTSSYNSSMSSNTAKPLYSGIYADVAPFANHGSNTVSALSGTGLSNASPLPSMCTFPLLIKKSS